MSLTARYEEIKRRVQHAPCIESLGITLIDFDEGFCRLTARHDRRFNGLLPGFHGGMLATVADCAAWFAIATVTGPDEPMVTADLFIRYLAPCNGDATAEARVIKAGRTLCPTNVQLFDPAGKPVAYAVVTYARTERFDSANQA